MEKREIRFPLSSGIFARVLSVVQNNKSRKQDTQLSSPKFFECKTEK